MGFVIESLLEVDLLCWQGGDRVTGDIWGCVRLRQKEELERRRTGQTPQSSSINPGTSRKSRVFAVTMIDDVAKACAAIIRSKSRPLTQPH